MARCAGGEGGGGDGCVLAHAGERATDVKVKGKEELILDAVLGLLNLAPTSPPSATASNLYLHMSFPYRCERRDRAIAISINMVGQRPSPTFSSKQEGSETQQIPELVGTS